MTSSPRRYVLVTLDTEVDKDRHWRISNPVRFTSVTDGVPQILTSLFRRYGVRPTYFLSPEVIEDTQSAQVLGDLQASGDTELGTHLHCEFIEPGRTRFPHSMAGQLADAIQKQLAPEEERAKLANLTGLYEKTFRRRPTSFRAGRFGMSASTLPILASLGYVVDSSITPGLRWIYPEGTLDYRSEQNHPRWMQFNGSRILELPVSVRPGSPLAPMVRDLPDLPKRAALKLFGQRASFRWLRPSWGTGADLINYVQNSTEQMMVMLLHSMEIVPGASPYAQTLADVARITGAMEELFIYCRDHDIGFCTMTEAAQLVTA